ncbi:suppressor of fused domain protein [Brevibacillus sp. SIMBA_040]|uniref:suppressor of fused domain protein n=1 Tax=unclassified Brevibacillus TaxID=2684853 RepID=UPI00397D1230
MIVVKQVMDHCSSFFGYKGDLYQCEVADVLIAVYPATRKRGWWTYVTLELHKTGASECVLYSYQFDRAMITHLANIAHQVMRRWEEHNILLQKGSVFLLEGAIQETSVLDCALVTPVYYEEVGFEYYTNGKDVIRFMMLHAIAKSEAVFAQRYGMDALEELFARTCVDSLNVMRTPAI